MCPYNSLLYVPEALREIDGLELEPVAVLDVIIGEIWFTL
jgi:hypothetical protein